MKKNPVFIVGGWNKEGKFIAANSCVSNSQSSATQDLKEAIKDKSIFEYIHYSIYKFYPEEIVKDNSELQFYDDAQKLIELVKNIQGNICISRDWQDQKANIRRNISIYANRSFSLDPKTNTLVYKVSLQHYGDLRYHDCWQDMEKDLYDSIYCVEIPKMKEALKKLNTNIRISIVDSDRRKLVPGFITK